MGSLIDVSPAFSIPEVGTDPSIAGAITSPGLLDPSIMPTASMRKKVLNDDGVVAIQLGCPCSVAYAGLVTLQPAF